MAVEARAGAVAGLAQVAGIGQGAGVAPPRVRRRDELDVEAALADAGGVGKADVVLVALEARGAVGAVVGRMPGMAAVAWGRTVTGAATGCRRVASPDGGGRCEVTVDVVASARRRHCFLGKGGG